MQIVKKSKDRFKQLKKLKEIIPPEIQEGINIEEELIFPDDQVVKFPVCFGITGQVFKTCGVIANNCKDSKLVQMDLVNAMIVNLKKNVETIVSFDDPQTTMFSKRK